MDNIKEYYSQKFVHYLIAKYVYERTIDFIIPRTVDPNGIGFRYRRAVNPGAVMYFFEKFNVFKKPFNLYASVVKIDSTKFPIISMEKDKAREQRTEISENFKSYVIGYDLKIDIDNLDLDKAHFEASQIKKELDKWKLPYWVMFSGNKGFNFTIDSRFMPDKFKDLSQMPEINHSIIKNLTNVLRLKSVDLSIYQINRIFKVPYSVERNKNLVALPLTDEQFNNFNEQDYTPEKVLRNVKLMNRGLLERPGTKENVLRFYEHYAEKKSFFGKIKEMVVRSDEI